LQAYTYNDLFELPLRSALGPLAKAFSAESLVSRLMLFQGLLHSAHSAKMQVELKRSPFPSIPATTITLTAMANAHRIGSELGLYV